MNQKKPIELREYQKKSVDEHEALMLEGDLDLKNELEAKKILTISTHPVIKKTQFKADSKIGVARFTNFTVTINPKFTDILNLVKLINYTLDVDIDIIPESEVKFRDESDMLTEVIFSTFRHYIQDLLMQGLYKSYATKQDYNMPYLRGKLLLLQQLQNDARLNAKFACEYDELEYNNLENQILLFCLHKCRHLTVFDSKRNEFNSMIQQMDTFVKYESISIDDFKKLNYTRLNQYYEKTHQLCKIIIQDIGISDFYEQETSFVNSFFIDMNDIFEKFFFKLVKEYYPLPSEQPPTSTSWTSTLGEHFGNKPDGFIYDENGKDVKYIIDTKYKYPTKDESEIKRGDIRQMLDYMSHQGKNEGYLIYPKTKNSKPDEYKAENRDFTVKTRYIGIDRVIELLDIEDDKVCRKEIQKLLQEIIN